VNKHKSVVLIWFGVGAFTLAWATSWVYGWLPSLLGSYLIALAAWPVYWENQEMKKNVGEIREDVRED
jgi:hypothetical protein